MHVGRPTWVVLARRHANAWVLATDWRPCAIGALPSLFDPTGTPLPPVVKMQHFGSRHVARSGSSGRLTRDNGRRQEHSLRLADDQTTGPPPPRPVVQAPPAVDGVDLW